MKSVDPEPLDFFEFSLKELSIALDNDLLVTKRVSVG
jgi:hypothetical protein